MSQRQPPLPIRGQRRPTGCELARRDALPVERSAPAPVRPDAGAAWHLTSGGMHTTVRQASQSLSRHQPLTLTRSGRVATFAC